MNILILAVAAAAVVSAQPADTIYHNGKVVTVSDSEPVAQAVAIRGNRFIGVGADDAILKLRGPATTVINLNGRTVLPGMIESHGHPVGAALAEQDGPVPSLGSIPEIQAYIRQQAKSAPRDRLIFVPKVYASRLRERRYPTRQELDVAAPGHPAMCDNGYASVLNSVVLAQAKIDGNTPEPKNGKIIKDANGEPTGLVLGAPDLLGRFRQSRARTHADLTWAIREMHKAYNRAGITTVFDRLQNPEGFRAYQEVHRNGEMRVRTNLTYYITAAGTPADVEAEIRRIPAVTGWGDEWLKVGPLKTTVDGGILIGTAYLREPYGKNTRIYGYSDPDYRGVLSVSRENLFSMARVANELGWQMTAHATGGGALDLLLEAYEAADKIKPIRDRRFNVMHANFPNAQAVGRAKALGVVFDSQIAWLHADGDALKDVFGPERMSHFLPFRILVDQGLTIVGGSDLMIRFDPRRSINPYHPFYGMWMAITRKTVSGAEINPEQRITREEALRMWTINGAYNGFEEKIKGSIESGKLADLVIIEEDFLNCPVEKIRDIEPLRTVVDGRVVYESPAFAQRLTP
ncbi:MAG TPA: amidohydrolase [Bryobacteraceae bacterium]|nr:amidohydrolase [Bryobacteraceae bacterium]